MGELACGSFSRPLPVLIRIAELRAIRDGVVDLAFRRWERPRVRVGTKMRTKVGLVEVTSLERVDDPGALDASDARRAGADSLDAVLAANARNPERPLWRVGLRHAGADPREALRAQAALSDEDRAAIAARLARFDAAATGGPWTATTLALIAAKPAVRAPDLAASLGRETAPFKRDVRKLKELGLTESLEVGYRISPRGEAYLRG